MSKKKSISWIIVLQSDDSLIHLLGLKLGNFSLSRPNKTTSFVLTEKKHNIYMYLINIIWEKL